MAAQAMTELGFDGLRVVAGSMFRALPRSSWSFVQDNIGRTWATMHPTFEPYNVDDEDRLVEEICEVVDFELRDVLQARLRAWDINIGLDFNINHVASFTYGPPSRDEESYGHTFSLTVQIESDIVVRLPNGVEFSLDGDELVILDSENRTRIPSDADSIPPDSP
jgi:hypothetical protein